MGAKIKIECYCGNVVFRYKLHNRPQKFCSRKCFLSSEEYSILQREKMVKRGLSGNKSYSWKGENVSYKGIHQWVSRQKGAAKNFKCEMCKGSSGSTKMEWSNMDMKYSRDLETWRPLCKKCHSRYDQDNFGVYGHEWTEAEKKKLSKSKTGTHNKIRSKEFIQTIFLSELSNNKIQAKYGINRKLVSDIKNRLTYREYTDELATHKNVCHVNQHRKVLAE